MDATPGPDKISSGYGRPPGSGRLRASRTALLLAVLLLNARSARSATCSFNPAPDPTIDGAPNSLRSAIQTANASGQDCLITLGTGAYTLTIKNTHGHENSAAEGDLDISDSGHTVTIQGQGAASSIVNGNGIDRVFHVLGGAKAVFSNLTIRGGIARDDGNSGSLAGTTAALGGGILVDASGHASMTGVTIKSNYAIGGNGPNGANADSPWSNGQPGGNGQAASGGGIYSSGSTDLSNSTISGNTARGGAGGNGGNYDPPGQGSGGAGGPGGAGSGGGLYAASHVNMSTSTVSGNIATGGAGGSAGASFHFASDGASGGNGEGGGLFIMSGTSTFSASTVSGNSVTGGNGGAGGVYYGGFGGGGGGSRGAGLFVANGSATLANSTVSHNTANNGGSGGNGTGPGGNGGDSAGGGLFVVKGNVKSVGVTIASNRVKAGGAAGISGSGFFEGTPGSSLGGGIRNTGATTLVSDSTLIGNNTREAASTGSGPDVSGAISSMYSLIGQTAGAAITDNGHNILGTGPLLDPAGLQENGGPTATVALKAGSPAIDAGDNVICLAPPPSGLGGVDQRGFPRSRPDDPICDIGAFELVDITVTPALLNFGAESIHQQTAAQTVSVTNDQTTNVTLSRSIEGANPGDFKETSSTCGTTLGSHATCSISIAFRPTAVGARLASLSVSGSPGRGKPYSVTLMGQGIPPKFAGQPGTPNCVGKSVSALVQQYHGLPAAASALGFPGVKALQEAIGEFCER